MYSFVAPLRLKCKLEGFDEQTKFCFWQSSQLNLQARQWVSFLEFFFRHSCLGTLVYLDCELCVVREGTKHAFAQCIPNLRAVYTVP
eukprot:c28437_g1_i1 orf=1-258(-)